MANSSKATAIQLSTQFAQWRAIIAAQLLTDAMEPGLSPKFLPTTRRAFGRFDAQRWACAAYVLSQQHEGWKLPLELYDDGGHCGGVWSDRRYTYYASNMNDNADAPPASAWLPDRLSRRSEMRSHTGLERMQTFKALLHHDSATRNSAYSRGQNSWRRQLSGFQNS